MKNIFIFLIVIATLCLGCCAGRFVLDSLNIDWAEKYNELPQTAPKDNTDNNEVQNER